MAEYIPGRNRIRPALQEITRANGGFIVSDYNINTDEMNATVASDIDGLMAILDDHWAKIRASVQRWANKEGDNA